MKKLLFLLLSIYATNTVAQTDNHMNTIIYLEPNGIPNQSTLTYDVETSTFTTYIEPQSFVIRVLINSKPFLLKKGLNAFEKHVCLAQDYTVPITNNHYGQSGRHFSFTFDDLLEFDQSSTPTLLAVFPKTTFIPNGENAYTATVPTYMDSATEGQVYAPTVLRFQFSDNRPNLADRTGLVEIPYSELVTTQNPNGTYTFTEQYDLNGHLFNLTIITTVTDDVIKFEFSNAHGGTNLYGKYENIELRYN